MYAVEIDAGGYLQADAHSAGTQEFLTVHTGQLAVRAADEEHLLRHGDSIRFKADARHSYHAQRAAMGITVRDALRTPDIAL